MEVRYSKQAIKFLKKQDIVTRKRIVNAISLLPAGDAKSLQGRSGYRLRIGDFRIIFDKQGNILYIEKIGMILKRLNQMKLTCSCLHKSKQILTAMNLFPKKRH